MPNIWKELTNTLSEKKLNGYGKVVSVLSNSKKCVVELKGNGTVLVRGEGVSVGDHVIIENGVIVSTAPSLPIYNIEI